MAGEAAGGRGAGAPARPPAKKAAKKTAAKKPARQPAKQPQRQAAGAGGKKGPKSPERVEFDRAWTAYRSALAGWKSSLESWNAATERAVSTYEEACKRAQGQEQELLKKVNASWEEAWGEVGPGYVRQQTAMMEDIFKRTNLEKVKKFNEQWEKFLKTTGEESLKAYEEALRLFNGAWQS